MKHAIPHSASVALTLVAAVALCACGPLPGDTGGGVGVGEAGELTLALDDQNGEPPPPDDDGEPPPPPPPQCTPTCIGKACGWQLPHGGMLDGNATLMKERNFALAAGTTYVFETRAIAPSTADPVLHLVSAAGTPLASADGGAAGTLTGARLVYTPATSSIYTLVVRAKSTGLAGTADIYKDGVRVETAAPFGGWSVPGHCLRANERIDTVERPGNAAADDLQVVYVLASDGVTLARRFLGGAGVVGNGVRFTVDAGMLGTRTLVVGVRAASSAGTVRLVRNDLVYGHDPDADGLGSELEASLGTCSALSGVTTKGFDCALAADARDSDGDGLREDLELYGMNPASAGAPPLRFPRWGADPRHKDVFIEVDFREADKNEAAALAPLEDTMPADDAVAFAAYYADAGGALSGTQLRNPDGKPGMAIHLDTGRPPLNDSHAVIYGDWGGHNVVNAVDDPDSDDPEDFKPRDPVDVWQSEMSLSRRGLFHYSLARMGNTGQTTENRVWSKWTWTAGDNDNGAVGAHEFGHSLNLGHSGMKQATGDIDPNCKPLHRTIMNYAYSYTPGVGFSDGSGGGALNNAGVSERFVIDAGNASVVNLLRSVFEYDVDDVNGHVDGIATASTRPAWCAPTRTAGPAAAASGRATTA